ncbi:MAG: Dynein light chain [Piccolia ochrophora]|nr:MAG: Dynein light chain [Piccolia ochrophora]
MSNEKKEKLEAQIKSADMSEEMQQEVIDVATDAMTQFGIEKVTPNDVVGNTWLVLMLLHFQDIAQHIKKEFDAKRGATWHCIVGRNFGSFVTHETKHFIYFYLGHNAILLFKTQ